MTLLAKVVRHGPADLLLAVEALLLLAFFRVCLALVAVRKIIGLVTRNHVARSCVDANRDGATVRIEDEAALATARRVQWAVSAVARHSPVEFVCFPQTLAGYTMLRRRGVQSTMVYGVARSPAGELKAHTWLDVGDRNVLGGEGSGGFTPIERWT
jgi:hypothetical protein